MKYVKIETDMGTYVVDTYGIADVYVEKYLPDPKDWTEEDGEEYGRIFRECEDDPLRFFEELEWDDIKDRLEPVHTETPVGVSEISFEEYQNL